MTTAQLVAHVFEDPTGTTPVRELVCLGCDKKLEELTAEARADVHLTSRCPTPHETAEVGQVMSVAESIA